MGVIAGSNPNLISIKICQFKSSVNGGLCTKDSFDGHFIRLFYSLLCLFVLSYFRSLSLFFLKSFLFVLVLSPLPRKFHCCFLTLVLLHQNLVWIFHWRVRPHLCTPGDFTCECITGCLDWATFQDDPSRTSYTHFRDSFNPSAFLHSLFVILKIPYVII